MPTYSDLIAELPDYLENESAEYAAAVPQIVADAQQRLNRDLNVHPIRATITGTFSGATITSSGNLLTIGNFLYTTSGGGTEALYARQASYIRLYGQGTSGDPKFFARTSSNTLEIAPTPASGYAYQMEARVQITPVSSGVASNWFTDQAYETLRAACLAESGKYAIDDRQQSIVALYEQTYQQLVQQLNAQEGTTYEVAG